MLIVEESEVFFCDVIVDLDWDLDWDLGQLKDSETQD